MRASSEDFVELLDSNMQVLRSLQNHGRLRGNIVQADIHHALHAMQFLKPIGLLDMAMSAAIKFRENKLNVGLRDVIAARGGEIEELSAGAFKQSGTGVHTVIASIPGR